MLIILEKRVKSHKFLLKWEMGIGFIPKWVDEILINTK
jgi:hypothetical protein